MFVDLRDPRELEREGRLPGAVHCPRGMLEFWIDPESPYHKPVFAQDKTFVFFCAARLALRALGRNGAGYGPEARSPMCRAASPRGRRQAARWTAGEPPEL